MQQVQHVQLAQIPMQTGQTQQQEATQAVQTLAEVAAATQGETVTSLPQAPQATPVDMNTSEAAAQAVATLAEATLADGTAQIMLSGDGQTVGTITGVQDGQSKCYGQVHNWWGQLNFNPLTPRAFFRELRIFDILTLSYVAF